MSLVVGKVKSGSVDRKGLKLPTAYGMLLEGLDRVLKDDWAVKGGGKTAHILLSTTGDLAILQEALTLGPVAVRGVLPPPCAVACQSVFDAPQYKNWAKQLGYTL